MAEIIIGEDEPSEGALKRFNKRVQQDGIFSEARWRALEKPSMKRKEAARLRKLQKKQRLAEARVRSGR